jgi:mono/diheme cytochrome c family protein
MTRSPFRWEIVKPLLAWLGIFMVVGNVLGGGVALGTIYSGVFNVAATVEDAAPLRWVLITTREASIKRHARDIQVPSQGTMEQVESGFRIFRESCAICHTPPGRQVTGMSKGLNPQPPSLTELVEDMTDVELFWVTKHGIRFTGMPAWASYHNDQAIWALVAFLRTSPNMKATDYDAFDRRVLPGPPQ